MKEIHTELNKIERMLEDVSNTLQELRDTIRGAPNENKVLQMRESYQHPWWQHHGKRSDVS
jgi:regulator of replication initiation timing